MPSYHLKYDAPLTSDVAGHARLVSDFVRVSESADDLALAGAEAVQAALRGAGQVATFIAPANHAWEDASRLGRAAAARRAGAGRRGGAGTRRR
jgi:acetolactate synthase I/II/III large subunit